MVNVDNLISGFVNPELVDYYKERAVIDIVNYLGIREYESAEIIEKYPVPVVELCKYYTEVDKQGNLSSRTQGQRSETFVTISQGVPSKIKNLLPKPRLRVRG